HAGERVEESGPGRRMGPLPLRPTRVRHDVGAVVLQALEERLPLGIDRVGDGLVAGVEVLDVVGIAAVKERGAGEGGVGILTRHAQGLERGAFGGPRIGRREEGPAAGRSIRHFLLSFTWGQSHVTYY